MAVWIELRCERRGEYPDAITYEDRCWSDDNHGPGLLADDNAGSIARTYAMVKQDALNSGWQHTRSEGWVCPNCAKRPKPEGDQP